MYDRLTETYTELAKKHDFRMIPVGKAVQLFRAKTPVKYAAPTAAERKSYICPDVPRRAGEVVGNESWVKDEKTGEMMMKTDRTHLRKSNMFRTISGRRRRRFSRLALRKLWKRFHRRKSNPLTGTSRKNSSGKRGGWHASRGCCMFVP